MYKKIILLIVILIVFTDCKTISKTNTSENKKTTESGYFDLVNQKFSGDLAYETTAFVEKYWRVVGNKGFNESIYKIAEQLEKAGYILEDKAPAEQILTYRIEKRPLKNPTWEPVSATVKIEGETLPLLEQTTNRNMVALNSHSTPKGGVSAEVVHIKNIKALKDTDVKGKIVFVESSPSMIFQAAYKAGALGILSYSNPDYLQPKKNTTSIQFRSIRMNENEKRWVIAMSYAAKERLKQKLNKGTVKLNVAIKTKIYPSEELTIVADIKGSRLANERLVFSAHVQEPGANDNATGVGVALEMAVTTAQLIKENKITPQRTLTFLWGDEIVSTRRYVEEDKTRAKNIKWGISLDMVGENTTITGGSFLIEKMPDPSAIWTRGNDKHSEWGGMKMSLSQMKPHYLNDFVIGKFKAQGKRANWVVNTNPFEGGSDHVPFLRGNIPSVLFWHFTDQFYHTDNDRLDKVSKETLKNVGIASLVSAYTLLNADENSAKIIIKQIENSALERLTEELKQGKIALEKGEELKTQIEIVNAWKDWYVKSIATTKDMVSDDALITAKIETSQQLIENKAKMVISQLKE